MSGEPEHPEEPAGLSAAGDVPATLKREGQATLGVGPEAGASLGDRPEVDLPRLAPGEQLAGRFTVLRFVARGGMGAVYEANDVILRSRVALKVLQGRVTTDAAAMERFRREVLLARRVGHPNVCHVYELYQTTTASGLPIHFLTMEFLDGETLATRLTRQGRLSTVEALPLVQQMCDGLAAAHAEGVVHRDFKTGNILLVPRSGDAGATSSGGTRVVITDFGVARALAEGGGPAPAGITGDAGVLGTPEYMAPEQVTGGAVSPATDVYALGVVIYQMVTGRLPFSGETPLATAARRLDEPPPRPETAVPGLDARWSRAIMKCLDRDPRRRFQRADEVPAALSARPRGGTWALAGAGLFLLLVGVAVVAREGRWPVTGGQTRSGAAAAQPSVAVLPFVDMSAEHDQEYFSDGVAQEIINALAQVPGLHVAARSSSFSFKGKSEDLRTVGQKLDVAHVLEGSVRKSGGRLRITAQLVSTADGYQLWSQTFDRELADIFAVQDQIARAVVAALRMKVLPDRAGSAPGRRATTPEAYTLYLRGLQLQNTGSVSGLRAAIEEFERAIAIDPGYAPAHARIAESAVRYANAVSDETVDVRGWSLRALREAERAVELDPNGIEGLVARALIRNIFTWDRAGARADVERAVALGPGDANAQRRYAQVMAGLGHLPEAIEFARTAVELDPVSPETLYQLGNIYNSVGEYALATQVLRKAMAIAPEHGLASRELAFTELLDGRPAEALSIFRAHHQEWVRNFGTALAQHSLGRDADSKAALDRLVASSGKNSQYQIAAAHAWRGERDLAFEWLEKARLNGDAGLQYVKYDPLLRSLRGDPRYAAFLEKMKLPLD